MIGQPDDYSDIQPIPRVIEDPDADKEWYRNSSDGQSGYLVVRDGKKFIRLDRPNEEILKRFDSTWVPRNDYRTLQRGQVARIAFEADRVLCMELGDHEKARREWASLPDEIRMGWVEHGPNREVYPIRSKQWRLIMSLHLGTEVLEAV